MSQSSKSIELSASWKGFFWEYLISLLLTPLLVGIFLFIRTRRKHKSYSYTITDRSITVKDGKYSEKVDIADIRNTEIKDLRFGTGTLILKTASRKINMPGIEKPEALQESVEKAVQAELKRIEAEKQTQPREPEYEPGTMDRMDYLTGLWQQGLMSDEDYHTEKKKFE